MGKLSQKGRCIPIRVNDTGNMRLLTHRKSQFIYHTCVYNCLCTCIYYQIPVLFQFHSAILWNPLESSPILLDSTGLHWILPDSTRMTRFRQEQGGHCKVLNESRASKTYIYVDTHFSFSSFLSSFVSYNYALFSKVNFRLLIACIKVA